MCVCVFGRVYVYADICVHAFLLQEPSPLTPHPSPLSLPLYLPLPQAILSRGEEKTAEMNSKLEKYEKGDLLDFKLEYSGNLQEFGGKDYTNGMCACVCVCVCVFVCVLEQPAGVGAK